MKLNWGHKLAIAMTLFIGFIVTMGIIMGTSTDSIEESNYYEKGLHYDNQIEKEKNTRALSEKPVIRFDNSSHSLVIVRPIELKMQQTSLLLYKPNAKSKDLDVDISELEVDNEVRIPMSDMPNGKWIAKFNWSDGERAYYLEKPFIKN